MTADAPSMTRRPNRSKPYDVVVVGAGPAGIAAACAAAENGASVAVLESSSWVGGQIWHDAPGKAVPAMAQRWRQRLLRSGAEVFCGATVFAVESPKRIHAETAEAALEIGWNRLVLATGARELLIPFPGWTLPGAMGVGGLQTMAKGGWPVAGKRVVVAGSGPLLLAAADGLKQQGAKIVAIAEQASWSRVARFGMTLVRHPGKLCQGVAIKLRLLATPYHFGCWPIQAEGNGRVESVTLTDGHRQWSVACDYLACGFGLIPSTELAKYLGCVLRDGFVQVDSRQQTSVSDVFCAGEPTGIGGADRALIEGRIAGLCAAGASQQAESLFSRRAAWHRFHIHLANAFALRKELKQLATLDTVVCRCEDIRWRQLEPYASWRAAKLHTRCGMGPCQGRTCGSASELLFGWKPDSMRPPVFPVRVGVLAGEEKADSNPVLPAKSPS